MCNLYYADLWIMPTIGSEPSLATVIAALEPAWSGKKETTRPGINRLVRPGLRAGEVAK